MSFEAIVLIEMIDDLDRKNQAILACLKNNSRMSWQQIGQQVHLTGQAVALRVEQMQAQGIISAFTIRQDQLPRQFIVMYMENPNFVQFEQFLLAHPLIEHAYKISGDGCYQLVAIADSPVALDGLLNELLTYGRYKVSTMVKSIK